MKNLFLGHHTRRNISPAQLPALAQQWTSLVLLALEETRLVVLAREETSLVVLAQEETSLRVGHHCQAQDQEHQAQNQKVPTIIIVRNSCAYSKRFGSVFFLFQRILIFGYGSTWKKSIKWNILEFHLSTLFLLFYGIDSLPLIMNTSFKVLGCSKNSWKKIYF